MAPALRICYFQGFRFWSPMRFVFPFSSCLFFVFLYSAWMFVARHLRFSFSGRSALMLRGGEGKEPGVGRYIDI